MNVKVLKFVGSSLDDLRDFPDEARRATGFELRAVQNGLDPSDWKPMHSIGAGVTSKSDIELARKRLKEIGDNS